MSPMRFAAVAIVVVLAGACAEEKDPPDKAQRKAECRRVIEHIIQITPPPGAERPETDPKRIEERVAKVPIEDLEQCAESPDRKVITCMQQASSVAALRACIPAKKG